jgi:hypothetical protein
MLGSLLVTFVNSRDLVLNAVSWPYTCWNSANVLPARDVDIPTTEMLVFILLSPSRILSLTKLASLAPANNAHTCCSCQFRSLKFTIAVAGNTGVLSKKDRRRYRTACGLWFALTSRLDPLFCSVCRWLPEHFWHRCVVLH